MRGGCHSSSLGEMYMFANRFLKADVQPRLWIIYLSVILVEFAETKSMWRTEGRVWQSVLLSKHRSDCWKRKIHSVYVIEGLSTPPACCNPLKVFLNSTLTVLWMCVNHSLYSHFQFRHQDGRFLLRSNGVCYHSCFPSSISLHVRARSFVHSVGALVKPWSLQIIGSIC